MKRALLIGIFAVIGGVYGLIGGYMNENPYYYPVYSNQPNYTGGWNWEPSVLWITSYILCKKGIGIEHERSGYMFYNSEERERYHVYSSEVGIGIGLVCGVLTFGIAPLMRKRRRADTADSKIQPPLSS